MRLLILLLLLTSCAQPEKLHTGYRVATADLNRTGFCSVYRNGAVVDVFTFNTNDIYDVWPTGYRTADSKGKYREITNHGNIVCSFN